MAPEADFDPPQHLTYADIAVDNLANPKHLQVNIKQSKTDTFRMGAKIWIGKTGGDFCPVAAVLAYMGPLFHFQDGSPLTRQKLVARLREPRSMMQAQQGHTKLKLWCCNSMRRMN